MANKFMMPDGKGTNSTKQYIHAWRELAYPVLKLMPDVRLHSFDPGLSFSRRCGGSVFGIDRDLAFAIKDLYDKAKKAGVETDKEPTMWIRVHDIIMDSGLNELLNPHGHSYFLHLNQAEREYGVDGVKSQILYILNNCARAKTPAQKEAKAALKGVAR